LSIAESLDGWEIYGYVSGGSAHFLALEVGGSADADVETGAKTDVETDVNAEAEILRSVVDLAEYEPVVDAARRYCREASGL
jgi:hypothetical protein